MSIIKKFMVSTGMLILGTSVQAESQNLSANDGFQLASDYYQSEGKSNKGVLMLHQCNYNRSMYNDIGEALTKNNIHAVSFDLRGFGESISKKININNFASLTQKERRAAWQRLSSKWPSDVKVAFDSLIKKTGKNGEIAVIGASCGGSQAIELAKSNKIKAISFFSSAQNEKNIQTYTEKLANKPTLIIASELDGRTYTSAQSLFEAAKNDKTKFILYKGDAHGYPLLASDPDLTNNIVNWLTKSLL